MLGDVVVEVASSKVGLERSYLCELRSATQGVGKVGPSSPDIRDR